MEIYPGDTYPDEYYEQVYGPMLEDDSVSPEVKEKLIIIVPAHQNQLSKIQHIIEEG